MATFAIKCPHCLRDNTSFTVIASNRHDQRAVHPANPTNVRTEVFGVCNACKKGVCSTVDVRYPQVTYEVEKLNAAIDATTGLTIHGWMPLAPTVDMPAHLPDAVERAYSEAERLKLAGFRGPAGNAYRRALEAAIKHATPEGKGNLFQRIESLATAGKLTTNMKDFAHRIRTLGNEASHETPVIEDDEIDDLAVFTKLFLMYEFTLPGMLPVKEA
jgi:hypothetical protein